MAGETVITLVGNLVDEPELRFTPSGAAVANFRVASTPRVYDRTTQEFKDGDTLFITCSVWRQVAENVAETLEKGMRVIISGRLKQRTYETKEGEKRTVTEIDVDEVGPSLRSATASVTRNQRTGGSQGGGQSGQRDTRSEGRPEPRRDRSEGGGRRDQADQGWQNNPRAAGGQRGERSAGQRASEDPWADTKSNDTDGWGAWPPPADSSGPPPF